jgi:hypothetical protein
VLLNLESAGNVAEVDQSWDDEIRARIKAVGECRVTGIAYDDLRKEMNPATEQTEATEVTTKHTKYTKKNAIGVKFGNFSHHLFASL